MVRLKLLLCAEGVVVDQRTNSVSVFAIVDEIMPQALPVILTRFVVLVILEREEGDPDGCDSTLILRLNDEIVFEQEMELDFQGKRRVRHMIHFGGVPIENPGTLIASLRLGDREVGKWDITVKPPKKPVLEEETGDGE